MKKGLIVLVVIAIVGVLASVAVPGLWSHGKQWREDIAMKVDEVNSDEHVKGMYETAFSEVGKKLRDYYCDIYQVKRKIAEIERTKATQEKKLVKEEQILQRAQELLEKNQPGTTIVIGGTTYSWEQLNNDALRRVSNCKVVRRSILNNEQSLSKLQRAYADGMDRILDVKDKLRKEELDFEAEKAELAALRAQEQVSEVIGKIYDADEIKTDLGRARKIFKDRLDELRARAEYDQEIGLKADVVDTWNTELGIPEEKALENIKTYFQEKSKLQE